MSDRGDSAISKVSRSARRAAAAAAVIVSIDRTTSLFHSRLYYARELQTPRRLRYQADRLAAKNVSEMTYFVPSTWDAERIAYSFGQFKRHATPAATAPYRPPATQHARGDWPRVWFTRVFPLSASSAWCPVAGKAAVRPRRSPTSSTNGVEFPKVRRYNWHSAGSLGWPFPVLKYKYIFQINYTEAISSNSTWKLLWFEITKMLIAV